MRRQDGVTVLDDLCQSVYEYVLYYPAQGELDYLYVGYDNDGVRHLRIKNADHDFAKTLPETANRGFVPMYNMMALSDKSRSTAKVVILTKEADVESFEDFFRESKDQYVAVSFLSGTTRQIDCSQFAGRDVVLWPEKTEDGDVWGSRLEGYLKRYAKTIRFAKTEGSDFSSVMQKQPVNVVLAIEEADGQTLDKPVVRLMEGFSSLSGFIPPRFLSIITAKYGDAAKHGRIDADYDTIMKICAEDPAFHNFVKLDRATGQMSFSPIYHRSYDEADNALLVRLNKYGVKRPEKALRYDIIKTLSLKEGAVFNSILDHFNRLSVKYPNPKNHLEEILSYVQYEENEKDKRGLYYEMFDIFFSRAASHILRAYTNDPIPNDLVPVFVGSQGVGKSRFVRYLAMEDRFFQDLGDKGVALGSPDCIRYISGKVIVELSEMSTYSRTEIGVAKAFISQTVDEFRQIFERDTTKVPRSSNMVGTTNEAQFLRDMTGNRRFFPVRVKKIRHEDLCARPELMEETWAFYYKQAKYQPDLWYGLSVPVQEFFFQENEIAMEISFNSEVAYEAIKKIEPIVYRRFAEDKKRTMHIGTIEVGTKIQEIGGTLPGNTGRVIKFNLAKLGYEERGVRVDGKVVRRMCISMDDPGLLERIKPKPAFEAPEF